MFIAKAEEMKITGRPRCSQEIDRNYEHLRQETGCEEVA
jgi:hypothetical protein